MNHYEINEETLAVVGVGENQTKIIEENNEYVVNQPAYVIMDESCKYFGSSYEGREIGTKTMLDAKYKLPVIVEESRKLIFFPTESPLLTHCAWIALRQLESIREVGEDKKSKIQFKNGKFIILNTSKSSLNNQLSRSTRLEYVLNSRKMNKNG